MLKFLKPFSVFVGTIIGVGIFGLPYVAAKSGFFIVLIYFIVMTALVVATHFLYAEITLGTKSLHRFPGYVNEYFGPRWKNFTLFTTILGIIGALLAYLIVGGEFLKLYFTPYFGGGETIYTLIFFGLGATFVFLGIKSISQLELSFLILLIGIVAIFFIKALPAINVNYFKTVDWKFLTFPYGVVIFSLWGLSMIPEIKEMSGGNRKLLKRVISSGIIFSALIYLIFVITILGVSGPETTKEAFAGFANFFGGAIPRLGFIFGVITTFTSFITLALTLQKTFQYDFGLKKNSAFLITCFAPLALFLFGFREFINIIGFIGAISLGIDAIILVFIYKKFLAQKFSKPAPLFIYPLAVFLVLGIIFEIIYVFSKTY